MSIRWGSTLITAVKWGNTNCTAVYWGGTKVFPNSNAYNGSTFADPIASGFTLWCYSNWDPDNPKDSLGKKKDVTSGSLYYSLTNIGKKEGDASYNWISRNPINFTPYNKIVITLKRNYYNSYETDTHWYACYVIPGHINGCNSNAQNTESIDINKEQKTDTTGGWDTELPKRDTWYDFTHVYTITLVDAKPTSAYLKIPFAIGRNHTGTNGSTGTFYHNITSIVFS